MRNRLSTFTFALVLFGLIYGVQAASAQANPSQPDAGSAQKKKDSSTCMKWAKQQAGLDQSSGSQDAATAGTADKEAAAAGKGADQSAQQGAQSAQQGAQSAQQGAQSAASSLGGAAAGAAGSLGGAANSKAAQLVKEAYEQCMKKKGYSQPQQPPQK